jgi:hypothetical protein
MMQLAEGTHMSQPITVEVVLAMTEQLPTVEKVRLIEGIAPQIARDLDKARSQKRKSLRGLWRSVSLSAEEIDSARRELWQRTILIKAPVSNGM